MKQKRIVDFDIDRYLRNSKRLDLGHLAWDEIPNHPLSDGDVMCLHYMMDIETHTVIYLRDLLATRAAHDPYVTGFLSCWVYEKLWHGEALAGSGAGGEPTRPNRVRDTGAAMSQENVEIVRRNFDAVAAGDAGVLFEGSDPDIRVYPRPEEPDAATEYRGLEGLLEYLTNWYGQWDEYKIEPVEITDAGEHVLAVIRERGRVARTGVEVEAEFTHSFVLRDGKVLEWHMYDSHAQALAAVGRSA